MPPPRHSATTSLSSPRQHASDDDARVIAVVGRPVHFQPGAHRDRGQEGRVVERLRTVRVVPRVTGVSLLLGAAPATGRSGARHRRCRAPVAADVAQEVAIPLVVRVLLRYAVASLGAAPFRGGKQTPRDAPEERGPPRSSEAGPDARRDVLCFPAAGRRSLKQWAESASRRA